MRRGAVIAGAWRRNQPVVIGWLALISAHSAHAEPTPGVAPQCEGRVTILRGSACSSPAWLIAARVSVLQRCSGGLTFGPAMSAPVHTHKSATARSLRAAAMHRFALPIVLVACEMGWHTGESAEIRVNVAVGEMAGVDVAHVNGADDWSCDPSALIEAKLDVRHGNYWSVTGVDSGTTRCRIGNVHNDHVNVTVTIAPRRP